jgi:hypothetical protein
MELEISRGGHSGDSTEAGYEIRRKPMLIENTERSYDEKQTVTISWTLPEDWQCTDGRLSLLVFKHGFVITLVTSTALD